MTTKDPRLEYMTQDQIDAYGKFLRDRLTKELAGIDDDRAYDSAGEAMAAVMAWESYLGRLAEEAADKAKAARIDAIRDEHSLRAAHELSGRGRWRAYAAAALQGLLADGRTGADGSAGPCSRDASMLADYMLAEENKRFGDGK